MSQVYPRRAASLIGVVCVAALLLTGCGGPPSALDATSTPDSNVDSDSTSTPDPNQPPTDPALDVKSYQVSGGDGIYQFSGVICDASWGSEIPAVGTGIAGDANLILDLRRFSFSWSYGEGSSVGIDTALGEITNIEQTEDTLRVTASYRGYASIGDAGTNTAITGEMVFEGPRIETPQSCVY